MSSQPQGLRTPQRSTYNTSSIFDEEPATPTTTNPFTPCTRLSRMTIESQSNGLNGRLRKTTEFTVPVSNFNDRLMEVVREEEQQKAGGVVTHPNLDMFLGSDRISMLDKSKDQFFNSFSEDEESDEGDLFSSSLCPMSSPERILTRQSIFDDEPMNSPPTISLLNRKSIFDDDDDEEDEDEAEEKQDRNEDYYDPSTLWLSQIYQDNDNNNYSLANQEVEEEEQELNDNQDNENIAPRFWNDRQREEEKKYTRRTLPYEEDNTASNERLPLREIRFEDYLSDDESLPAKKKLSLGNGKHHKMRFMRTLSPPRYAKRKGKETDTTMPLSPAIII